jgi:hypothetical protein
MRNKHRLIKRLGSLLGAAILAAALSGCVVVPERGGYYHPYHAGYYVY